MCTRDSKKNRKKMLTVQELQDHFIAAVLYYCGVTNSDATRYYTSYLEELSSAVGTIGYDGQGDWEMATWEILGYSMPTNVELRGPNLVDIVDFWNSAYAFPYLITTSQPLSKFTTTELNNLETSSIARTDLMVNITTNKIVYYDNAQWNNLY